MSEEQIAYIFGCLLCLIAGIMIGQQYYKPEPPRPPFFEVKEDGLYEICFGDESKINVRLRQGDRVRVIDTPTQAKMKAGEL